VSPKKTTSKSEARAGIESTSELAANKKLLIDVIDRAQDGDEEALKSLKRVLDEVPKVAADR
jgi:DNA transposition AAA+ family ATPase